MIGFLGLLLRFVPFVGPLGILLGFVPRLLHLRREKAVHAAVGEPFPQNYESELDAHTIRTKMAAYRLGFGLMGATAVVSGVGWYASNNLRERALVQRDDAMEQRHVAMLERDKWYVNYTDAQKEMDSLRARVSEQSKQREGLISVNVKAKTAIRKKRAESEAKLPVDSTVDPADWLRIQAAPGADTAGTSQIPNS